MRRERTHLIGLHRLLLPGAGPQDGGRTSLICSQSSRGLAIIHWSGPTTAPIGCLLPSYHSPYRGSNDGLGSGPTTAPIAIPTVYPTEGPRVLRVGVRSGQAN